VLAGHAEFTLNPSESGDPCAFGIDPVSDSHVTVVIDIDYHSDSWEC